MIGRSSGALRFVSRMQFDFSCSYNEVFLAYLDRMATRSIWLLNSSGNEEKNKKTNTSLLRFFEAF